MHNQTKQSPWRNEIDAPALRAWAASGFGDAPIGVCEPHELLDSTEFCHRARAHRSYQLRETATAIAESVADFMRRMVAQWRMQRKARATYEALSRLDARVLRDLGMHRSEILSVSVELARGVGFTRVHAS